MSATPSTQPKFCRLSPQELTDKHKKGEYYFCPKKFTPDHICPMKRVFVMELDDQEDLASVAEDLGISLHALIGLSDANTMQLIVSIGSTNLRALVYSESTHTFIHDEVVHRLAMAITFHLGLSVRVVNGEQMQSYGTCKSTTLSIQGETFQVDCYTLPLEGFDVILGVQWLKSLGPIVLDFMALSMAFLHNGCSVRFIGCGGMAPSLYTYKSKIICSTPCSQHILTSLQNPVVFCLSVATITAYIFCRGQLQWSSGHIDTHNS
jgi:hypothetical protein